MQSIHYFDITLYTFGSYNQKMKLFTKLRNFKNLFI